MAALSTPTLPACLAAGEAGDRHRRLDDLLLKHEDAFCLRQRPLQRWMVISDLLAAKHAGNVGVHTAALDRPGPDQRHLNNQLLDARDLDSQQHLDLGSTL